MKWLRENNLYSLMVVLVFASFLTVNAAEELSFFGRAQHKYKELSFSCRRLYGQLYKKPFILDQKELNQQLFNAAQRGSAEGVDAALCAGADADAIFNAIYCAPGGRVRSAENIERYSKNASLLLGVCGNFKLLSPGCRFFLLGQAVRHKREDQVRALLDVNTCVNVPPLYPKRSSLSHQAAYSNARIVQLLIDAGADFSSDNLYNNNAPLCRAAQVGNVEVVKTLLAAGAHFNNCRPEKERAVRESSYNVDILDLLIKEGLINTAGTVSFQTGSGSETKIVSMDLYQYAIYTEQYDKVRVLSKRGIKSDLSSYPLKLSGAAKSRLEALGYVYDEHRMAAEDFLDESSSGKLYRNVKDVIITDMLGQQRMTDIEVDQLRRGKLDRQEGPLGDVGLE